MTNTEIEAMAQHIARRLAHSFLMSDDDTERTQATVQAIVQIGEEIEDRDADLSPDQLSILRRRVVEIGAELALASLGFAHPGNETIH